MKRTARITWISENRKRVGRAWVTYLRVKAFGKPGVLIVESVPGEIVPEDALVGLRLKHWNRGPVGSVTVLPDVSVGDFVFARCVFQIDNPQRSTVLSAASRLDSNRSVVAQFVMAGLEHGQDVMAELFDEALAKVVGRAVFKEKEIG